MKSPQDLNRKELESYIVDLFYNQNKTYKDIQGITRKSFRDIKAILDKVRPKDSITEVESVSSKAYQMFEEGKSPIQVAIALNLREKDVSELHREWWNLNERYRLNQFYDELHGSIWSIAEFYRRMKAEGLTVEQIIAILRTNERLQQSIFYLKCEEARLKANNKKAADIYQHFTSVKFEDMKIIEANDYVITKQKMEIDFLSKEKARLEKELSDIMMKRIDADVDVNVEREPSVLQILELEPEPEPKPKLPITFTTKDFEGL
jgi:hypothetical protein